MFPHKVSVHIAYALGLMAVLTSSSAAQTISGTTTGLFSNGSPTNIDGLSYTANTAGFSVATSTNGSFAIGGSNNNHLGFFSLASGSNFIYDGNSFTLTVNFTAPTGAGNQSFTAALSGQVTPAAGGGANIDFGTAPKVIPVSGGRTLTFFANSMSLTPGSGAVALTGRGTLSPVPEPASLAALGIGVVALGRARRRR